MICPYQPEITDAADKYSLDKCLVAAFCFVESSFDPGALRYEAKFQKKYIDPHPLYMHLDDKIRSLLASSLGLMQVMGVVACEFGLPIDLLSDMFQPATGLEYGCKKLKSLFDRYKPATFISFPDVISAYNAGTARRNGKGQYVNEGYVNKVWNKYQEYRKEGPHG
jgi:soluble lytic murein transglycosylase-like protein